MENAKEEEEGLKESHGPESLISMFGLVGRKVGVVT